ncbi:MAG: hypothetical protein KatS3mg108_2217 [Isosphaeraceae bacterium]|jgi:hypothetical protein|nr:MAG: hypothetical protein KatS3mg108_2217 [Isosphaeraceae bacterium]
MKRLALIALIVVPLLVLIGRPRDGLRLESAPLPPRPEAVPAEPAEGLRLRLAWGDRLERRKSLNVTSTVQIGEDSPDDSDEADDQPDPPRPTRRFSGVQTEIASAWMSTPERARRDFDALMREQIGRWLADSGIDAGWSPPDRLIAGLKPAVVIEEQDRDYARLYRASAVLNFSEDQRTRFVREYDRQLAEKRLGILGGVLGFVLACLGVTTAYLRADEASRGYYTVRLRFLAAAAIGAAAVLLVQWLRRG